jgi:hypothetical protein
MAPAGKVGFNWEAFESWRAHPLLKFQKRNAVPGFFLGAFAAAGYIAFTRATGSGGHH